MTRRLLMATLTAGLVLALVGCGVPGCSSKKSSSVTTTVVTTTLATSPTTTSPPPPPTTTVAAEAPCGSGAFLPILKEAFDGAAPELTVVEARVERCRNDYAQVFAVPDQSVCDPGVDSCFESEQVFLHWDGSAWTIETSGTGIACGAETEPDIVKICRALGYPDLTNATFKMPSKNIGCAFFGGTLRCDILSGMVPEPTEGCPYDWVGLVMTTGGAAEPQCAGDTVYDGSAPTLTYGGTWKRGGITCKSSEAGLACSNGSGHEFKLSREGWSAS